MTRHDSRAAAPTRRRFLQGMAALGVGGGVLAACGDDDDDASGGGGGDSGGNGDDIPSARIGYVTPQTGPLAAFGEADAFVLAAMREELGDAVEIVDRDSESDSGRAGEVAQELINEGVELVLVSSTPDTTVPVASACDLGEVPCISTVAPWQPHYLGLGGELGPDVDEPAQASAYNWHFFWGLEDVIENFIALWEQSGAPKVVGGLWPNDPDGNAWSDAAVGFPPALEAAGFTVVDPGRFPVDTQDFSAQIAQFREDGVAIVSGVVPPPTFANYQSQALQQGFNPPVVTVAKALLFPERGRVLPAGRGAEHRDLVDRAPPLHLVADRADGSRPGGGVRGGDRGAVDPAAGLRPRAVRGGRRRARSGRAAPTPTRSTRRWPPRTWRRSSAWWTSARGPSPTSRRRPSSPASG